MTDWRLPENRRTAFRHFYAFHLRHLAHPGLVYSWLPALAQSHDLDDDGRAWLVWLNGNTQNPVTSLLLLQASEGDPRNWKAAVDFWNDHFRLLEWDTDRRHQKGKFGEATEAWSARHPFPGGAWSDYGSIGWASTWRYATSQPYMGRLSAWSMTEYARILFGPDVVPDATDLMLTDVGGSNSHRNGLALLAGYDATYWTREPFEMGIVGDLALLAEELLDEQDHPDACRLTLESALCTYKSWHKPNRRYPGVYADMAYNRLRKAEAIWGHGFQVLWDARQIDLPAYLRLEDNPHDPGLDPRKQNHYRLTGEIPVMFWDWPELGQSGFDENVMAGAYGTRKERW